MIFSVIGFGDIFRSVLTIAIVILIVRRMPRLDLLRTLAAGAFLATLVLRMLAPADAITGLVAEPVESIGTLGVLAMACFMVFCSLPNIVHQIIRRS